MAKAQTERNTKHDKECLRRMRDNSPYSKDFKCYIKSDQKDLQYKRQMVTKLLRKDLEDKYIELCDENYFIKRKNNEQIETIKKLTAKIIRITEGQRSFSTSAILKENIYADNYLSKSERKVSTSQVMLRASSLNTVFKKSITPNDKAKNGTSTSDVSSTAEEKLTPFSGQSNSGNEKGQIDLSEKENSIQDELTSLKKELENLKMDLKVEHDHCVKLIDENRQIENRLSEVDLKKFLIENVEVNRLKRKLESFRSVVRQLQTQNHKTLLEKNVKIEEERRKNAEIRLQLETEHSLNKNLGEKINELKSASRTIAMMKKQISELQFDKKSLMEQQENLSTLLKEAASYQNDRQTVQIERRDLMQALELLKTEKAAIENSKNEMFSKIRQLQDRNDQLLIDLEGIKAERNICDEDEKTILTSAENYRL